MKFQVLISAMNQKNTNLVKEMNIESNAIIINQSQKNEKIIITEKVEMHTYTEIGIGKSRNRAIEKAEGEICLIADDDMRYVKNYEKIILKAFHKYKDADILIFDLQSLNEKRPLYRIKKDSKVGYLNFMRYGACRIAFRRNRIIEKNIKFSLEFGGGTEYGSGEDTLFLYKSLRKGLKIYAIATKIADVTQETSTWDNGITEKLYYDKGALFAAMGKKKSIGIIILMAIKQKALFKEKFSVIEVMKTMFKGRKEYLYREQRK